MAIVRELAIKIAHVNGDTSTLRFNPLSTAGTQNLKARIKAINAGVITINGDEKHVNYQPYLLSKAGSEAVNITGASLTTTDTQRVYTQGQS